MKLAAVHAIADWPSSSCSDVVNDVHNVNNLKFGREYYSEARRPTLDFRGQCGCCQGCTSTAAWPARPLRTVLQAFALRIAPRTKLTQKLYATAKAIPSAWSSPRVFTPPCSVLPFRQRPKVSAEPILLGNDEAIDKLAWLNSTSHSMASRL